MEFLDAKCDLKNVLLIFNSGCYSRECEKQKQTVHLPSTAYHVPCCPKPALLLCLNCNLVHFLATPVHLQLQGVGHCPCPSEKRYENSRDAFGSRQFYISARVIIGTLSPTSDFLYLPTLPSIYYLYYISNDSLLSRCYHNVLEIVKT